MPIDKMINPPVGTLTSEEVALLNDWAEARARRMVDAERVRCSVLTDDMLRYAMAALGTGSPREAERLRAFWLHAITARDTSF